MSLIAGSLFGVFKGVALVVFNATAGASSCYLLSKLMGRPIVFSLWPDKLQFFQNQVNSNVSISLIDTNFKNRSESFIFSSRWLKEERDF